MDWKTLAETMQVADKDLPPRSATIIALSRVLYGAQYDHLQFDFSKERGSDGKYVPLIERRPSVRTHLCGVVVDDAVSLLFGDQHFPQVVSPDKAEADTLRDLIKQTSLNLVMIDAATRGSVGSVAILFRVLSAKPFFTVMPTQFMTPVWKPDEPDTLASVTEKYKVDAKVLVAMGYAIKPDAGAHWFQRQWTNSDEFWFTPWPVSDKESVPSVDADRSIKHGLGFVPLVWVKNLPGGDDIDGACTFERGIDTVIELDYLLSQAGRGLKYSSDPLLVLKSDAATAGETHVGGSANALVLPDGADAKLLEINGQAANAMREHARELRSTALELMHGNRAHSDKLTMPQSGRAMEMTNRSLIGLASNLRVTYGEGALLSLIRMVCAASKRVKGGMRIGTKRVKGLTGTDVTLRWPTWYQPTHDDREKEATALKIARDAGLISTETGVSAIAPTYDIEDIPSEMSKIEKDKAEAEAREIRVAAAVQVKETAPA